MAVTFNEKKKTMDTTATVADDIYTVDINVKDFDEADIALMGLYGEPVVEFGGEIKNGTIVIATLPSNLRKIRSQVPYTQEFPAKYYANPTTVVDTYGTVMTARIKAALDDLRNTTGDDLGTSNTTY